VTAPAKISPWLRGATAAWFLLLFVFAAWTRLSMCREGLWRDEAISVYTSNAPSISELLRRNQLSDYNPPLFNLGLAAYTRVAGSEETPVKLFAVVLGLMTLAGATLLACEIGGRVAGVLAAALVLNNPILVEMSTEVRTYSLSAFLCVLCLYIALRLRKAAPRARPASFACLTAVLVLLVYSHLAGAIVAAVLCFWGLVDRMQRPTAVFGRNLALSALAACAAFLPWIPTAWRQFRAGIPWEKPLGLSENFASLFRRSRDVLPIPGAFEQPAFVAAAALLLGVGVLLAPRVVASLRRDFASFAVPALAGAAVWLALGLFGRQSRYLIIPATLACVVFAAVVSRVVEAARQARPAFAGAALLGIAGLVVSSFSARADLYEERLSAANRPKSGIRSLCRARPFGSDGLVVVAPDYLAPTLWYYCGRDESLHGFARWERPFFFDIGGYAEIWRDPAAPARTMSRIEEAIRQQGGSRFALVLDASPAGLPRFFDGQFERFKAEMAQRYEEGSLGRFPGRVESVEALHLNRR
jgi:hypothetical protein